MKGKRFETSSGILNLIDHMESDLLKLKGALMKNKHLEKKRKKTYRSVRQFEFCGMWKEREDMQGLSSADWLAKLRREQWGH